MKQVDNSAGIILYESPSVRHLAGFTSDEIIGRYAYDFVHPDDVSELQRQLRLALAGTPGLVPAEFRHKRADGSWRVVQAVASRLIEDGRITGATLRLNGVLAETVTMLSRIVGEDAAIDTVFDPELGAVHADQAQLEQALADLCMNSREAMPRGGRITVTTSRTVLSREHVIRHWTIPPGTWAVLSVADTGAGMTDDVLQHIFEPFFSTKPRARGAGLGLASVYGTVAQSGGYVAADSTPSVGTVVSIYLPAVPPVQRDAEAPGHDDEELSRGAATVLLVEDNDLLSTFAHSVLRSHGYQVLAARNADEAEERESAFGGPIDLLLTDVVMPGRSGVALAERIVRRRPAIRCLYMSGYNDEALLRHGVVAGTLAFLAKPFTARGLLAKVRDTLAGGA